MTTSTPPVPELQGTVLILAGGRGSRMHGQDKGLLELAGKPCIEHLLERLGDGPPILISANRNRERYARYGYPVIADDLPGYAGPLAGFAAALEAMQGHYLLTVPVDAPFLCPQYAARMKSAMEPADTVAAVAQYNGRMEPVFSLLRRDTAASLHRYLHTGGRSVRDWLQSLDARRVDFDDCPRQFLNLNTPDDLRRAEAWLAEQP